MARGLRASPGGYVYHVLNRANGRLRIFGKAGDFEAFEAIVAEAVERYPVDVCGYCIMGNHWHMLLRPGEDGVLSDFMRWVTLTHTQRWHGAHSAAGMGHLYQGRFKSFPVQGQNYYLTAMRYIEANPLRAGLVKDAGDWEWSSYAVRQGRPSPIAISNGPIALPANWGALVHRAMTEKDLAIVRNCVGRGAPYGDEKWVERTAAALNLRSTLRPRGRPRKEKE
jgi:putative transposase